MNSLEATRGVHDDPCWGTEAVRLGDKVAEESQPYLLLSRDRVGSNDKMRLKMTCLRATGVRTNQNIDHRFQALGLQQHMGKNVGSAVQFWVGMSIDDPAARFK